MPFVEENINLKKKKKKVSKCCHFDFKQKTPSSPKRCRVLSFSIKAPRTGNNTHPEKTHESHKCLCYVISRSVDLEDSPDFTAYVEEYVARPQVVQQRTPPAHSVGSRN
jgi:hypothetical protein